MNTLPDELRIQVLLNAGYPAILNMFRTNTEFWPLRQDELLWKRLFKKDFPGVLIANDDRTWRQAYEELWTERQRIRAFADEFLTKFMMANPRYVKREVMLDDLANALLKVITEAEADFQRRVEEAQEDKPARADEDDSDPEDEEREPERKSVSNDTLVELTNDALLIASGLMEKHVGSHDSGDLDFVRNEMYVHAESVLQEFLGGMGITIED